MENIKLSYYTIPVKLESEANKYLLIHGYTGAIDVIDGNIWKQLERFPKDCSLSKAMIALLQKRGYLTSKTKEEEINYVIHLAYLLHQAQSKLYKSFGFIISYNCNFRCPYCFENAISGHGKQWSKQTFSKDMIDKAYDSMLKIEPRKELHFKNLLLYGGEPFLRENKDIIKYIVNKGSSLGYTFKAITNGYDLDYFKDILLSKYFTYIQITLDGNKKCHNSRRFHYQEGPSFDKILSNIDFLLKKKIHISIRVNTDEKNFKDLQELKDLFKSLNYEDNPYFKLYSSVLREYETNKGKTKNIDFLDMNAFQQQHLSEYEGNIYCQDFGIYRNFYSYLSNKSKCRLYSAACSSQYGSFLFDPNGNIFTCLEAVGKKELSIGTYIKDNIQWSDVRKHWFERNVGNAPNCKSCKYALLCGGGCLIQAQHNEKGFGSSYCYNYQTVFPLSINRAYKAIYK